MIQPCAKPSGIFFSAGYVARRSLVARSTTNASAIQHRLASLMPIPVLTYGAASLSHRSFATRAMDKFGIGGHKWQQLQPEQYKSVIQTALEEGITLLEAGQEGGDHALYDAYMSAVKGNPGLQDKPVTILTRLGYRTVLPEDFPSEKSELTKHASRLFLSKDVQIERVMVKGYRQSEEEPDKAPKVSVVHNISPDYVKQHIKDCPFLRIKKEQNMQVIPLLHNPEAQAVSLEEDDPTARQNRIQERLIESFVALEEQVTAEKIPGYGIVSNGLNLPADHPMHLSIDTIFQAAAKAKEQLGHNLNLKIIQLPANLLETIGIDNAKRIKSAAPTSALPQVQIHTLRPLTCYPDGGAGTGRPFVLADYKMFATMDSKVPKKWTNEMNGPPEAYQIALKHAMAHFDAEDILQAKQEGRELDTAQRETLDGCKLLQSLLHDVDNGLDTIRSFAAHEADLYEKIIPLINDTFEGYDEATAHMLQTFFAAYSMAVRYAIAKNTRKLLKEGEGGGGGSSQDKKMPIYKDLPQEMRLQEFALRRLLRESAIDKIMIGCSQPDQIQDDLKIAATAFTDAASGGAGLKREDDEKKSKKK